MLIYIYIERERDRRLRETRFDASPAPSGSRLAASWMPLACVQPHVSTCCLCVSASIRVYVTTIISPPTPMITAPV